MDREMKLYAVRIANKNPVPIGLFWAEDTGQLASMVDVREEPARCEYRIIDAPTCITFDHPSKEVAWGLGIKEDDYPDPDDDFGAWEEWFGKRLDLIRASISFDNDATEDGVTIAAVLNGEKDIRGWHKFSVRDLKSCDQIWGLTVIRDGAGRK